MILTNFQVLAILTLSNYIPGNRISMLEEALNQNLLASFLLVRKSTCTFIIHCSETFSSLYRISSIKLTTFVFTMQANVLTGLVNLSVDTLFVSSAAALAILLIYAFTLCAFVGCANFFGIKLKFW